MATDHTETLARLANLKASAPQNIAVQAFDPQWFETLPATDQDRLLACLASGLANPDSEMGCYAGHADDYDRFKTFFSDVLSHHHKTPSDAVHRSDWAGPSAPMDVAALGLPPLSVRIRVGRNLADLPLPAAMGAQDRQALEDRMQPVFTALAADPQFGGGYHSLTPGHKAETSRDTYQSLIDRHLMFRPLDTDPYLTAAGIAGNWPVGRGAYVSHDQTVIIWVGEEDHLRIMVMDRTTRLDQIFTRLRGLLDRIEAQPALEFATSARFGNITSCPTNLGTAMRASVHLALPNLTRGGSDKTAKQIARAHGLSVRGMGGEHTAIGSDGTVDLSPSARFCITETEILNRLWTGIQALKEADQAVID